MYAIPFPIFCAVIIVLFIGIFSKVNIYVRIASVILYVGFWLSFKADGAPAFPVGELTKEDLILLLKIGAPAVIGLCLMWRWSRMS